MKKILALLLVVFTLFACMTVCTSADEYLQDTVIEWDGFKKGSIKSITFDPTDITGAVALKFELYVGSVADFKITSFEIGTHETTDWKEKQFNGVSGFGELKDGWNTVVLNLAGIGESNDINPDDGTVSGFDPAHLCRIRMFNVSEDTDGTDVKIKNIVGVKEDNTEIKVGATPAPADPQPQDNPTPSTFDAASSVAVAAVAALGVALVASKKRH